VLREKGIWKLMGKSKWTKEQHDYLMNLYGTGEKNEWESWAMDMEGKFKRSFTEMSLRNHIRYGKKPTDLPQYKENVEIMADGSHKSDKLIEMSEHESKTPEYLLKAHGYNPEEWDLTGSRNSIWNAQIKGGGVKTLYASKVSAKPKLDSEFTIKDLAEKVATAKPLKIKLREIKKLSNRLLLIPLYDMHFGINTKEDYEKTLNKIYNLIKENVYEEVLFIVGSDLLHHNGFRSTTASGTIIENVNMEKAWEDASKFYIPLIEEAIKSKSSVKIIYSKGNHSEAMEWAFVKYLKALFPQAEYDDTFEERKIHVYGDSVMGFTHGDKRKKSLHNIFQADFSAQWGLALDRTIFTGHFHHEQVYDEFGTIVRTLPTAGKTDQWHRDSGFVGATKRFQIFEYEPKGLSVIRYV